MSKKKGKGQDKLTEEDLENFLKMMEHLPDEAKEIIRQMATGMAPESNDPDDLNIRYYSYEGPEQYNQGSKRVPKWLKDMWDAYDYDSWLALCEETAEKGKDLKDAVRSRDLKKYICMLIDEFYYSQNPEPNPIRLIGPLWLIEHYHLKDCLDMVLELLRQDAWFYTAYIDHAPQCVSAVLYQIGNDQPDLLKSMLYEQGLIPLIKPIVFNALVWIVLRQPKQRLATVPIMTAYLNHCLKICKQGASARNIDNYAFSLAYAHIGEARPILKRIYDEIDSLDKETFKEIESIYDDPTDQMEGQIFDSIDGYLRYHQEQADAWEDEYDEEIYDDFDEEENIVDSGIFDRQKQRKRYTIRIELLDAPQPIERTLQVPSNIRLNALAEVVMLAFGRVDAPTDYIFQVKDELYPDSHCNGFTLGDMLKKKNQTARFNVWNPNTECHWLHGLVLEKSADYSGHTTHFIDLLDGRGTYPAASVPDIETYTQRFLAGKLKQPNFKTVRDHIREFEDNNGLPF